MIEPVDQAANNGEDWREGLLARVRIVVVLLMGLAGAGAAVWHGSAAMQVFGVGLVITAVILVQSYRLTESR